MSAVNDLQRTLSELLHTRRVSPKAVAIGVSGLLLLVSLLVGLLWLSPNRHATTPTHGGSTETLIGSGFGFGKGAVWQDDAIRQSHGGILDTEDPDVVAAITKDAADMQAAGVTWIRWWVSPHYPVAVVTKVASIFQQHGISTNFDVNSGYTSDPSIEADLKDWLAGVVPATAKMGEHHWEVGNEPNIDHRAGGYWDDCASGVTPSATEGQGDVSAAVDSYVVRLRDAYTTIHAHDSQALVASAGLSYDAAYSKFCEIPSGQWIAQLERTDAWKYMDYFGIHPYADSAGGVVAALVETRKSLAANPMFADKPFAVTEVGFPLTSPGGEAAQAQEYVKVMNALKAYGLSTPVFWYDWYDYAHPNGFGITNYLGPTRRTYLPIYAAMRDYKP